MRIHLLLVPALLTFGSFGFGAQPLPSTSPMSMDVDAERLTRMHNLVGGYVEQGKHAGAVAMVVRNGMIVDWKAWGKRNLDTGEPMTRDTIFRIYSMSKVVTSVAVLQLFEAGKLRLNSPVTDWIPELNGLKVLTGGTADDPVLTPATNDITVRMLLNHTAGFTYGFFTGSPVHEIYKGADLWESESLEEFIGKVARLPLLAQPGTEYNYSIADDVLGLLIQRASGMRFEEFVARHITGPLKMEDTFFDVPKDKMNRLAAIHEHGPDGKLRTTSATLGAYADEGRGLACGGAGLFSTVDDYARFAQMLLNGGKLDGVRVLGRKIVELGRLNSLPEGEFAFSPSDGWGLFSGLRVDVASSLEPGSNTMFFWSGAATTHFFVDPSENLLALVFCQHFPYDEHQLFTRFRTSVFQALE